MNWYEYLGTSLILTGISMVPIFGISIYALLNRDINEKLFFIFVGSLLSYGVIGLLSVAIIPIEFIWNGVINPLYCAPEKKKNIICVVGHSLLGYGYMVLLLLWAASSFYIVRQLVASYWAVVSNVKHHKKTANN